MSSNVREMKVGTFLAQDWLLPKQNGQGGHLPDADAQKMVTAEWANHADQAFKQCNEAFNGLPIRALSVQGLVHSAKTAVTTSSTSQELLILKDIPTGWGFIEARATVCSTDQNQYAVLTYSTVFCVECPGDLEIKQSWGCDTTYSTWPAGTVTFSLGPGAGVAPCDSLFATLTGVDNTNLTWVVDFKVRTVPDLLEMPGAIEP